LVGGRKPVPTALKIVRGNPGRRPIQKDEFRPAWGKISCPKHLRPEARKEFRRLLKALGVMLTPVDRTVLSILCTSWARHVDAESRIAEGGEVVLTKSGNEIQSPWLGISNRAAVLHAKLCAEFGLTPSSRTRIHTGAGAVLPQQPAEAGAEKKGWGQFG